MTLEDHEDHVVLETVDAIEISEILEFLLEQLEAMKDPFSGVLIGERVAYAMDDLRADVARLTDRLLTAPFVVPEGP